MTAESGPTLVIIGGFAGCGKTTISRRLSRDLGWPRIEADVLGKTIRSLDFVSVDSDEAYRIGYAVLWRLCEDFLTSGVSVIVDANMAWDVAWESVATLRGLVPGCQVVPIILRCPRDVCLERIRRRFAEEPGWHGAPERFDDGHATVLWEYLSHLDRPGVISLDTNRLLEDVYMDVKGQVVVARRPGTILS